MSKFKIVVKTDSAAFDDDPGVELSRILNGVANKLQFGIVAEGTEAKIFDINGNSVGKVIFEERE